MTENLCGPSNGAKSLVNHVNRDRSLHQDRMVNGVPGSSNSSFRSQPAHAHANSADQAFTGFQNSRHIDPVVGIPPFAEFGHEGFSGGTGPMMVPGGPVQGAGLSGFAVPQPSSFAPPGSVVASHGASAGDWVNQFSSIQLGIGTTQTAVPTTTNPHHVTPVFSGAHFSRPGNITAPFASAFPLLQHNPSHMAVPNAAYGHQNQAAAMQHNESSLDIEAFNRAFGDYDELEFNDELASWAKEKEKIQGEQTAQLDPPQDTPGVAEEVVEKSEKAETGGRHREDEELARAAISILNSVSENDSEKFKNSNFFELMRRIGNREVVVDGPHLVNAATGESLTSKEGENHPGTQTAPVTGPAS